MGMEIDRNTSGEVLAPSFTSTCHELLSTQIKGEREAKDMLIAALIMGAEAVNGAIVFGDAGGGKSTLLSAVTGMIEGFEEDSLAVVPHRADLTGAKLVGDSTEMTKTETVDNVTRLSTITAEVVPILNKKSRVVLFDEINKTSPTAVAAAFGILGKGGIDIYEKGNSIKLSAFELVLAAMNNYGTKHTFALEPGLISRFGMGSFMGVREKGHLSPAGEALLNNDNYNSVSTITNTGFDIDHVHEMRRAVYRVQLPAPYRDMIGRLTINSLDDISDRGLNLAEGRFIKQIKTISRTFALMTNHKSVESQHVLLAFKYSLTAKLGALGLRPGEVKSASKSIFRASNIEDQHTNLILK